MKALWQRQKTWIEKQVQWSVSLMFGEKFLLYCISRWGAQEHTPCSCTVRHGTHITVERLMSLSHSPTAEARNTCVCSHAIWHVVILSTVWCDAQEKPFTCWPRLCAIPFPTTSGPSLTRLWCYLRSRPILDRSVWVPFIRNIDAIGRDKCKCPPSNQESSLALLRDWSPLKNKK